MNEQELKKLWDKLQGKINVGSFESFKSKMATPEQRKKFWDKYHQKLKDEYNFQIGNLNDYLNRLADNQNPPTPVPTPAPTQSVWDDFPCVKTLATSRNIRQNGNGSYTIDGFVYFDNGRKKEISTRRMSSYTCSDRPFTTSTQNNQRQQSRSNDGYHYIECPETLPIKKFCKNQTIKKIQNCIGGVIPDGKFGLLTQARLEELDLPGTRITANSLARACSGQVSIDNSGPQGSTTISNSQVTNNNSTSQTTNTVSSSNRLGTVGYYDDYRTAEFEGDDVKNQSNPANDYDGYSSAEGDDEATPQTQQSTPTVGIANSINNSLSKMNNIELNTLKNDNPLRFQNMYKNLRPIEQKIVDDKLSGKRR